MDGCRGEASQVRCRTGRPGWRAIFVGAPAAVLLVAVVAVSPALGRATPAGASTTSPWTVYHGDALGTGAATTGVTFKSATKAWTTAVTGSIFGEPLEATGRVFVATENDVVEALSARTGALLWWRHLGTAVPSGDLPCGDITPTVGITGTPVIDLARHEIFVVADKLVNGRPAHYLVGLDLYTGTVEFTVEVDPPGSTAAALLQRTGLNLDNGRVVFGYGGNAGDCGPYHGWIISVSETNASTIRRYEVDPASTEREGAIWMGGAAPEVDATGNIWAASGNGSVTTPSTPYDGSDSVFELNANLTRLQYFAPSEWPTDNAGDADLGSGSPALLSNGTVFQAGKSYIGYLLTRAHLGGIGGQLTSKQVCTGAPDGGHAVVGTVVYLPCGSGLAAVRTAGPSSPSIAVAWKAQTATSGPPIVAGGLVWSIDFTALFGIASTGPTAGKTVIRLGIGNEANHFPTPAVGDGLLLAPGGTGGDTVVAFAGSAGLPATPTAPSTSPPTTAAGLPLFATSVVAAPGTDGWTQEVFAVSSGSVFEAFEAKGAWSAWLRRGGSGFTDLVWAPGSNGSTQELFGLGAGGAPFVSWEARGHWSPFVQLQGSGFTHLVAAPGSNGSLQELFALAPGGSVSASWESPGGAWSPWVARGGSGFSSLAYAPGTNGSLQELFAAGGGPADVSWESANGTWSPWVSHGGSGVTDVVPGPGSNGSLQELFALGVGGSVWGSWESPGGAWSPWVAHGGSGFSSLMVAPGSNGSLQELFALGAGGSVEVSWESPGGAWSPWVSRGGSGFTDLVSAPGSNGSLQELFSVNGTDVYVSWESPGGAWSPWVSLG